MGIYKQIGKSESGVYIQRGFLLNFSAIWSHVNENET